MSSKKIYNDKVLQSFLMILGAVLLLSALSLFNGKISLFGWQPKNIRLFSDLFPITVNKEKSVRNPYGDSMVVDLSSGPKVLCEVEPYKGLADYSVGGNGLSRFMGKLASVKTNGGKVRIAYFGDSMIEGDLITGDLRSMFQDKFGGEGVGFVPITSVVATFRPTVRHTFSDDWVDYDFNSKERALHALAPSGHVFVVGETDTSSVKLQVEEGSTFENTQEETAPWVMYKPSTSFKALSHFTDVRLFYGAADNPDSKVQAMVNDNQPELIPLTGTSSMNVVSLNTGIHVDKIRLSFSSKSSLDVYGCSFESPSGVFLDNFAFRGSSGAQLASLPIGVTNQFDSYMSYDLVVLEYGLNVSDEKTTDVSWYVSNMIRSVNHLRACFPDADILLIGVPDKGYKNQDGEVATQPSIPLLVEGQRTIAKRTGVVFWDLYSAMGGYNTMKSWAEATPPLAAKDYTHINQIGARKVAKLLFDELMKKYASYAE